MRMRGVFMDARDAKRRRRCTTTAPRTAQTRVEPPTDGVRWREFALLAFFGEALSKGIGTVDGCLMTRSIIVRRRR
jgi:hypothetical protein